MPPTPSTSTTPARSSCSTPATPTRRSGRPPSRAQPMPSVSATPTRKDEMRLDGKTVLITGAGSGVGRASALLFAAEGAKVLCADVRQDWVDDTLAMVPDAGGAASAQLCDVTVEADVEAAVAAAVSHFGHLDVMF